MFHYTQSMSSVAVRNKNGDLGKARIIVGDSVKVLVEPVTEGVVIGIRADTFGVGKPGVLVKSEDWGEQRYFMSHEIQVLKVNRKRR